MAEPKKSNPVKPTQQQEAVLRALSGEHRFRSAQDIHADLNESNRAVGLTTVYRALHRLTEEGRIDVIQSATGKRLYRRCGTGSRHHHIVCRVCLEAMEISDTPEVEFMVSKIAERNAYRSIEYSFEISGVCTTCDSSAQPNPQEPSRNH